MLINQAERHAGVLEHWPDVNACGVDRGCAGDAVATRTRPLQTKLVSVLSGNGSY